jgi:hypothetical protein
VDECKPLIDGVDDLNNQLYKTTEKKLNQLSEIYKPASQSLKDIDNLQLSGQDQAGVLARTSHRPTVNESSPPPPPRVYMSIHTYVKRVYMSIPTYGASV